MKTFLLSILLLVFVSFVNTQVRTHFNNPEHIGIQGKYLKNYRDKSPYVIPARDIKVLLRQDSLDNLSSEAKRILALAWRE